MRILRLAACAAILAASLSGCETVNGAMSSMNGMMARATLSDKDLAEKTAGWLRAQQIPVDSTMVTINSRNLVMMEQHWTATVAGHGTYECVTFYNMGATYGDTCSRPVSG